MKLGIVLCGLVLALTACSFTPDTPGNAVMNYLTAVQVGKTTEARSLSCKRLRDDPVAWKAENMDRVLGASVFGKGLKQQREQAATVRLEVLFPPSERGAVGDPWIAHLVNERGGWRVCGFEPAEN